MTTFRVFFDFNDARYNALIAAKTPDDAASAIRKEYPGAIVTKVKVNRQDT